MALKTIDNFCSSGHAISHNCRQERFSAFHFMFIFSCAIKNASYKLLYKTGRIPYGISFGLVLEGKNDDAVAVLVLAFERNEVKSFSSIEIDDIHQLAIKNGDDLIFKNDIALKPSKLFENLMERIFRHWNLSSLVYYLTAERSEPTVTSLQAGQSLPNNCVFCAIEAKKDESFAQGTGELLYCLSEFVDLWRC
ncbi:hypothetical protein C2G38_2036931 [Gigaspora rosea]|uniref:Uncharacterized protein n=1 Tax=Gigaspora rosea TaxID=44941 RepID=A0A397V7Q1_9GLOM|nr:hypothetical protein C2G38_2036931 [Gigaspora rosea]